MAAKGRWGGHCGSPGLGKYWGPGAGAGLGGASGVRAGAVAGAWDRAVQPRARDRRTLLQGSCGVPGRMDGGGRGWSGLQ